MTPEKKRALEEIYDDARNNLHSYSGEPAEAYARSLEAELVNQGYDPVHAEVTIAYFRRLGPARTINVPLTQNTNAASGKE